MSLTYLSQSLLIIAPFITRIFNAAISNGRYPTLWRTSTITPVSKVARPQSPAQTRPIANLPHLARACDRLITLQISAYLEENSLLSPLQSGFRSGYSTQTALLKVTEDIRQAIDKSLVTVLVLFDFKCAFDTFNHEVLLRRLHEVGFGDLSLRLMHSFLSGRRQAVIGEGGATSSYRTCTSGVPQGSSPGPVLFSIFINSLLDVLQHCGTTAMLFADDLQIYLSCEPDKLNDTIARINADAHSVLQWSRDCGLTLNIPKTQAIVVASDQRHMRLDLGACSPVQIDGVTVPFQEKVRDLGMTIARNMSWKSHVNQLSSRVHGVLHRLRAHSRLLSVEVRRLLVSALVQPHFDYGSVVYMGLTRTLKQKLQRLQNTAIRFVYNLRRDAAIAPRRRELGWLTPSQLRNYFLGVTTHRVLQTARPTYLAGFLSPRAALGYSLRSTTRPNLAEKEFNTSTYENGFTIQAVRLWNSLPLTLVNTQSIDVFKAALKYHLLQ
ncbi:unnamed protein product [Trichogramma brassicae]|uniref:Reverse transcriptase domain-containing protein n=1 Tax=Trichogramma brassicae TaxID=86971 RepID=A0A6H5IH63_9HYME|nr:unnamed protein product [Trichogramma brassicae]